MSEGARSAFPLPDGWLEYEAWRGERGSVAGRVVVRPGVESVAPRVRRPILVHLPPSLLHRGARRYPVLYLHDGEHVFDVGTSSGTEWQIDETMEMLAAEGLGAVVVAIPNAEHLADPPVDDGRALEYSPHPHEGRLGGGADAYLEFIVDIVKPLVDAAFPTLAEPAATGIAGSSLGGLISLYALARRPDVFGFAGVMSPALWFADGRVLAEDAPRLRPGPRIHVDIGGREGDYADDPAQRGELSRAYLEGARRLRNVLLGAGFREGEDLRYVEDLDAIHHESAWAARGPDMLRFLLAPWRSVA